jgi:hypothetical protein
MKDQSFPTYSLHAVTILISRQYLTCYVVSHYEDHERDVVTVSSSGLQPVLAEHAELHSNANGPMPPLKLFLQPRIAVSPEEPSYPYPPYKPNITNINIANLNGHGNGSFYSSSPRVNENGINGHGSNVPPGKSNSRLSNPLVIDNPTTHSNKSSMELDMNFGSTLDNENTPPFRTPPRSPRTSRPLRTPPGSPKG